VVASFGTKNDIIRKKGAQRAEAGIVIERASRRRDYIFKKNFCLREEWGEKTTNVRKKEKLKKNLRKVKGPRTKKKKGRHERIKKGETGGQRRRHRLYVPKNTSRKGTLGILGGKKKKIRRIKTFPRQGKNSEKEAIRREIGPLKYLAARKNRQMR